MNNGRTMLEKIWELHVVEDLGDGTYLMFVDRHVIHELSGHRGQLEIARRGLKMRNPELALGSMDHVVSTAPGARGGPATWADRIIDTFRAESRKAGLRLYDIGEDGQGIVHVVGPELGFTLPGTLLVCGDSHTCTHGALGALACGIGTTELTHVLATQTIVQQKPRAMRVRFDGVPARGVEAKDLILALIGKIGTAGGGAPVRERPCRTVVCTKRLDLSGPGRGGRRAWRQRRRSAITTRSRSGWPVRSSASRRSGWTSMRRAKPEARPRRSSIPARSASRSGRRCACRPSTSCPP